MKLLYFSIIVLVFALIATSSQAQKLWTENDRKYLIDNLERTKNEVIKATENLTPRQWAYKETPEKWSVGQVLEHLGLYERIFEQEAGIMIDADAEPELAKKSLPDSTYLSWMADPNLHNAERNATPLGLMNGEANLTFFLYGRESLISLIKNTQADLKAHFTFRGGDEKRRSIHALMVVHFGHTDRHLRQIERIKIAEQSQSPKKPIKID